MKKLRQSGGYRTLASLQTTTIIYDDTVRFCERFLDARSRTVDQMIHVARSSLEELLLDFEDYLRQKRLKLWDRDCDESKQVRLKATGHPEPVSLTDSDRWDLYSPWLENESPEVRANAIICLIHQANFLLDQQVRSLERDFIQNGGYREQLHVARLEHRAEQLGDDSPKCPACGGLMSIRTARSGKRSGSQFWGCAKYPTRTGTVPID